VKRAPHRLTAAELPEWLPRAVADVALRLPPSDIVARLLCDERMKAVWNYLATHDADIDDRDPDRHNAVLAATLYDDRMPLTESASARDLAAAAFFLAIVDDLTRETTIAKRVDVDSQAQRYFDAAKLCRETIPDSETLTNGFFESGEALNFDLAEALAVIARIFNSRGDRIRADKPDIIERSSKLRGDDALRVTAREIAMTFSRSYGNYNYGLTAIITSVATGADVTKKSIANWLSKKKSPNKTPG
jgi:hypothetical protein